jgi:FKBP-type peptidyl-prolyl cis-trans isomerase
MARTHQRAFALVMALLFLATSVATGVAVVMQIRQDSKNQQATTADTKTAEDTQPKKEENKNVLQGTKLDGFTPVAKVDSLQKIDLVVGTGEEVQAGATVTAHYTGALASDGTIFQSSYDSGSPVAFPLTSVIKGWTDGVPGMKVGGKRRLLIPAAQAYGGNPPQGSGIPANADLVFDITLVKIGE